MSLRRLIARLAATGTIVAAGIAGAPSALAATAWWVDNTAANCSNTGPGTAVTPFCTISAAATRAVTAGDVVTVRPGNYPEQVTVAASGGSGAPITFTTSGAGLSSSRAPATAALDATGSSDPEGGPLRYTYVCGNGVVIGPTSSITASCQYASQGRYQIRLTATDAAGLTANKVVNIRLT